MGGWLETYRGTVFRWEVDHNDHFTVAYYFARIADAATGLLAALGLGPADTRTVDCYVRYQRELRVGDIMHVESGVIAVEPDGLLLGHKIFDSGEGTLCTTVEQRVRPRAHLSVETRRKVDAAGVAWDGPARERRPRPAGLDGFRDTARDVVQPAEMDLSGGAALSHYVHRFSAANGQAIAGFGITPSYMRAEQRGFSTFEFQL
ncbi:MAG TPA: thioesterase family protein, partial [Methylomirabilota bacterium]|nr:thioesterase family protein [Methylomirabilota bacterium]